MRLLGVIFMPDLKWAVHASNDQTSVRKMIGVLNKLGSMLNYQMRQHVVKAFVLPKLTYCLPTWGHLECRSRTAMDHTLLCMARVVLGNRAIVLDRDTYTATGILPIAELAALKCILAVHLALSHNNSYIPPTLAQHGSQIETRNITGRRLDVPRHRFSATEHSFYYAAAKHWNALLTSLAAISSRIICRNKLEAMFSAKLWTRI